MSRVLWDIVGCKSLQNVTAVYDNMANNFLAAYHDVMNFGLVSTPNTTTDAISSVIKSACPPPRYLIPNHALLFLEMFRVWANCQNDCRTGCTFVGYRSSLVPHTHF